MVEPTSGAGLESSLSAEITQIETLLSELASEDEGAARAELAEELVATTSMLADTEDRVLYPFLESAGLDTLAADLLTSIERLRDAADPVFHAVHHSAPIEVHQSDPEEFEQSLETLADAARSHVTFERAQLGDVMNWLPTPARATLVDQIEHERPSAIARPHPAHGRLRRAISRFVSKIDRPDTADEYRPLRDRRRRRSSPTSLG